MTSYNIAIIPGDGFGEESAREAVKAMGGTNKTHEAGDAIKEAILR